MSARVVNHPNGYLGPAFLQPSGLLSWLVIACGTPGGWVSSVQLRRIIRPSCRIRMPLPSVLTIIRSSLGSRSAARSSLSPLPSPPWAANLGYSLHRVRRAHDGACSRDGPIVIAAFSASCVARATHPSQPDLAPPVQRATRRAVADPCPALAKRPPCVQRQRNLGLPSHALRSLAPSRRSLARYGRLTWTTLTPSSFDSSSPPLMTGPASPRLATRRPEHHAFWRGASLRGGPPRAGGGSWTSNAVL